MKFQPGEILVCIVSASVFVASDGAGRRILPGEYVTFVRYSDYYSTNSDLDQWVEVLLSEFVVGEVDSWRFRSISS